MNIGDLVDDGLGNIGFIVALGWIFPESVDGRFSEPPAKLSDSFTHGSCWHSAWSLVHALGSRARLL